jgi:hypothetical protein
MRTAPEQRTTWPGSSILIWGTFGSSTPEGRRYHRRCCLALGVLFVGHFIAAGLPQTSGTMLSAILPGATFAFISWEFKRYLNALDELARRIQLEALAWTYLTGLTLACALGGVMLAYKLQPWFPNPLSFILLEPVRAVWLYAVSRRY